MKHVWSKFDDEEKQVVGELFDAHIESKHSRRKLTIIGDIFSTVQQAEIVSDFVELNTHSPDIRVLVAADLTIQVRIRRGSAPVSMLRPCKHDDIPL
jgi:hypothetical protein